MFDGLMAALISDVKTIKAVLRANEAVRTTVFAATTEAPSFPIASAASIIPVVPTPEPWAGIAATAPKRTEWQIFDHCAAFTRLYAIYEQYVTDLVTEYLRLLPDLYEDYDNLDGAVRTQHRVAVGQILSKWSETGHYRHLTERGIVGGLADGLSARQTYTLLPDAFLIDTQNYRAETIQKIFSYLGFASCWPGIRKHSRMKKFMDDTRDATETPETVLRDIVEYRNVASHSNISDVVSLDEIGSYSDFIVILCEAFSDMLKRGVLRRRIDVGHVAPVGKVIRLFGRAVGVEMHACTLTVGDELIAHNGASVAWVRVVSIRKLAEPFSTFESKQSEQLGIVVDGKMKLGTVLLRLAVPHASNTGANAIEDEANGGMVMLD